jgi:hypothetical protein
MVTDNDFTWEAVYTTQDDDQKNFISWAVGGEPYRAHTQWATFYEEYFTNTGDARVEWAVGDCPDCPDPLNPVGDAAVTKFGGNVLWYPQQKYDWGDNINLSSGWEARLIEAEAALNGGGGAAVAVPLMNQRRTDLGLGCWSSGSRRGGSVTCAAGRPTVFRAVSRMSSTAFIWTLIVTVTKR